jgi:protein SCO1
MSAHTIHWRIACAIAILATFLVSPGVQAASTGFSRNFVGMKLQDQEGRSLDLTRWSGRIVLINFVYTGCSTSCPVQTRALADMQRQLPGALRSRVQLLSVSLDPLQDTPAALKGFAKRMGADLSNWSFVTGRPQDVERLSQALRLFRPGAQVRKPDDHSTALWLVDPKGELRMRYAGNTPDVPRLLREIAALDALMNVPKS